jgi:hypothetical protein
MTFRETPTTHNHYTKPNKKKTTQTTTTTNPHPLLAKGLTAHRLVSGFPNRMPRKLGMEKPTTQMGCLRLKHFPSTFVILAGARQRAEGAPRIGMEMFNVSTEKKTSRNGNAMMEDDKIC